MDQEVLRIIRDKDITTARIDEFIGILGGIMADNILNKQEVMFIHKWLTRYSHEDLPWPASEVATVINMALEDNILTDEEISEVGELIKRIVPEIEKDADHLRPSSAPLDKFENVDLNNKNVVLTGTFLLPRHCVEEITQIAGANIKKAISGKIDFLFVGEFANDLWKHGTHGNKITKAIEYRDKIGNPLILSEECWFNSVGHDPEDYA